MSNFHFDFILNLGVRSIEVKINSNAKTVALMAPSGSGKSSFVRSIAGLNKNISGTTFLYPGKIGYVPQDSLLIPTMTVKENLMLSPHADPKDLEMICQRLNITELLNRYPRKLSGGERQRVSIGRALMSKPELLVLDEPFAALNFEIRESITEFIKTWITQHQVKLILITHDKMSSHHLCEEFWTIKENKLFISQ